jgi:CheY-like chemotaxis protein
LPHQVLDLNAALVAIERTLRGLIGKDIDLIAVPGPGLWRVRADPAQVEQVLLGLALRARDAMPRGGWLIIETSNVELDEPRGDVPPGPYALLAVSDTGGAGEEAGSPLFEPSPARPQPDEGTGSGLEAVREIARQNGGYLEVHTQPGRGTTCGVYLPASRELPSSPGPEGAGGSAAPGSETVLVVEDEPAIRDLIGAGLRRQGYTVLEARHGREALRISERYRGPIHLLLADVVLAQIPRPDLGRQLAPRRPDLKVLYTSAYPGEALFQQGVLAEPQAFLQKPFTLEALAGKVREVLDRAPAGAG